MARKPGEFRRFGGRWVREGQQFVERGRGLRQVLGRFWYLLVPFIGIMCANDTYVRPELEDIKNITNLERKDVLDVQDDLRAQASAVQTEVVTVEAEIDTLYDPRIAGYTAVFDSLKSIRLIYDSTIPATQQRIDSLQTVHDEIADENERLAEVFRRRSTTLDSLHAWQAELQDSIVALDGLITMQTDYLYRVRHPKDFRRKDALLTGEGEYPRRDENPPRQKGR
jgi:hypothetical protein